MQNYQPIYRDVRDWAVLDSCIIHDFSEVERPIEALEVLIGTLHYEAIDFNQRYMERRTPIIRWLTREQYEHLLLNAGNVIW